MAKLLIRRRGYTAKRRKETWVIHRKGKRIVCRARKKTWKVTPATFKKEDIGAPGRGKKLIKVRKGLLTKLGYSTKKPDAERHKALAKAVKKYGAARVWRMLHAQVVFRKRLPDHAKSVFKKDRDYIKRKYKPDLARKARRAWVKMTPTARARAMPGGRI